MKPNLLFIMTDHQRADSLFMSQCGREVTPNLNRLASEGAVFTRAYTTCPLCVPARTALATGVYPTENGVVFNDWQGKRAGDFKPVHQYLKEAGYRVGHVGVDHIRVSPGLRERVDFDFYLSNPEYEEYKKKNGISSPDLSPFRDRIYEYTQGETYERRYSNAVTDTWEGTVEEFKDSYFCSEAVRFLKEADERPFALFLYLWAPHPPLVVPEPYASMYDPAQIDLPENTGVISENEPENRRKGIAAQLGAGKTEDLWRRAWAAHLGLVSLADAGIGRLLDALALNGLSEHTLTLFTVDHGDHLGQHSMYQKMEMYEQAVNIPLMIRYGGISPCFVDTPVSHLDIVPSLLEWTGIRPERELDGRSLRQAAVSGSFTEQVPVFAQYSGNPDVGDIRRMVVSGDLKYVYTPGDRGELYDLRNDPLEMTNLEGNPDFLQQQQELHRICAQWHNSHNDWISYE